MVDQKIQIIVVIIFLLIIGIALGFFVFRPEIEKLISKTRFASTPIAYISPSPSPTPPLFIIPTSSAIPTGTVANTWKTYNGNGFSVQYPSILIQNGPSALTNSSISFASTNLKMSKSVVEKGYLYVVTVIDNQINAPLAQPIQRTIWLGRNAYLETGTTGNAYIALMTSGGLPFISLDLLAPKEITANKLFNDNKDTFFKIANSLKILQNPEILPKPTCMPRPSCLDSTPKCMIAEPASGWCP